MSDTFDVVVIGGGHAGCEAAHASARLGCATALITPDVKSVGRMSCNPAIGGPGKSQLVREVDALGGLMGRVTDRSGLQFRTLNATKGPAVRANRAQADTDIYERTMLAVLTATPDLTLVEGSADAVHAERGRVTGVTLTDGRRLSARAVVVTTGTFLNGLLHFGMKQVAGGRYGEPPSTGLSEALKDLGFTLARMKTGTPPRLDAATIDFSLLEEQPGDDPPSPFSFFTGPPDCPDVPCHITWTNEKTHDIIRGSLDTSPLFSGVIKGIGPRYCPSIEDKVVRFPDRDRHHIFLEPVTQSADRADWIYPTGISTSLDEETQVAFLRTIPGLERVRMIRPGYAVEYDFAPPTQLYPTLETKRIKNLFFAGQINGTSGYEEAAAQGIMAGINAARNMTKEEPVILGRADAYIGVMIDDLTTLGVDEPYRMFTSRAEHRLVLRQDNADRRLSPLGHELGLLSDNDFAHFTARQERIERLLDFFKKANVVPHRDNERLQRAGLPPVAEAIPLTQYLRRPDVKVVPATVFGDLADYPPDEVERAETEIKYEGYIARQKKIIAQMAKVENLPLSAGLDYHAVPGLSTELRQKLQEVRPLTFGQAARISGITPAALSILMVHLKSTQAR